MKEIELKLKEVETEINIHKLKRFTIKNFAENADLLMDYEMYYSIFCLTGHSNIYDIRKHFIFDENGIIISFNWGPNKNDIVKTMGIATENMFAILEPLRVVFSLPIEEEYDQLLKDYQNNYSNYNVQTSENKLNRE